MTTNEKQALLRNRLNALHIAYPANAPDQFVTYQQLLEDWNARINLTGDAAFDALLDKHLMDSLTPLTAQGLLPNGATVIDVGSGAGLPGIPLAIARPDLKITLLDSLKKRIDFLDAVTGALGLTNVTTVHARAEDAAHSVRFREQYDVALARAVAALPVLMELLLPFVKPGGQSICYKGPSVADELAAGSKAARMLGGASPRSIPVSVPYLPEHKHCLITAVKREHTKSCYPRKAGTPAKKPLGESEA